MNDAQILGKIGAYVDEEHALYRKSEQQGGLSDEEHRRLQQLKVALDQAWDLLDQRRGLRDAGRSPNDAKLRDAHTVENYKQ